MCYVLLAVRLHLIEGDIARNINGINFALRTLMFPLISISVQINLSILNSLGRNGWSGASFILKWIVPGSLHGAPTPIFISGPRSRAYCACRLLLRAARGVTTTFLPYGHVKHCHNTNFVEIDKCNCDLFQFWSQYVTQNATNNV